MTTLPAMSVVVITPDRYDTISTVLRHLQAQSARQELEVVIVAPTAAAIALDAPALQGFWRVSIVPFGPVASATAAARAAGVRAALAPVVAFVEDHSFPQPGWAEALIGAHRQPWAAVGPAVGNANPETAVSWANLLIEYAPWLDPATAGLVEHLPGHNSSYKRAVLLEYGATLETMLEAESILHWDLCAKGHQLRLEPTAKTLHMNFSGVAASMRLRFHGGRMFAAARARRWPMVRRLVYSAAAPLIPVVRFRRILAQARGQRRSATLPGRAIPVLLLLLLCDAAGELAGYLLGAGAEAERASEFEFNRNRYHTPRQQCSPSDSQEGMPRQHDDTLGDSAPSVALEPRHAQRRSPAMSVVITTPDSYETIRKLIGCLRAQTARAALELVIVAPSVADVRAGLADLQEFCCWRVIDLGALRTVAQAKAAGIRHATAPVVVLTEDHSLPDPTWAQALINAHRQDWAAVGPAMDNGNPESLISWADFIIGYGPWFNPPAAGEVDQLPGHNTSYKRDLLVHYGTRLEPLLGAETTLHQELRARGYRLYLEPAAKTFHVNFTRPTRWVPYLCHSGRMFAAERARSWSLLRRAAYGGGACLIPFVRLKRLLPSLRRSRPELVLPVVAPLFFALIIDAIGQSLGYTLGAGRAAEKVARLEFHREGGPAHSPLARAHERLAGQPEE